MNLDDLTAYPDSGRALLTLHRWCAQNDAAAAAVDLFAVQGRLGYPAGQVAESISALAKADETAMAMASMLNAMYSLERFESLAKSVGRPEACEEVARKLAEKFRELRKKL